MGVKMGDFAKTAIKPIRAGKVDLPGPKPAWLGKEPRISGGGSDKPPLIARPRQKY